VYVLKEKEQKILDASLKLFVERGFHGTSTSEIAKAAGVATGTLFHYFKTKEELINRLFMYSKESMISGASGHYDENKPLKENLKALWLKFMHFGLDESDKFQFILTFHYSPYITSLTREQLDTRTEDMLGVYKKGIESREIKEISFELAMDYFWGHIVSTVNHFQRYPENLNQKTLDQAFELFWDGVSR